MVRGSSRLGHVGRTQEGRNQPITMGQFARGYPTYDDWAKVERAESRYAQRIHLKHHLCPDQTRKELVHVRYADHTLTRTRWEDLTPQQKCIRSLAVNALRQLRAGAEFQSAISAVGLTESEVLTHLAPYYLCWDQKQQTLRCAPADTIEVEMSFFVRDTGIRSIVTAKSQDRSLIGRYMAAVSNALEARNQSALAEFVGKRVLDAHGVAHYFETDLEKLYLYHEMQEEPEFFEIYHTEE